MKRHNVVFVILLSLAGLMRVLHYVIHRIQFSIDSWPLLYNTKILLRYSPIALDSNLFDGYNNYWPLSQLSLAIYNEISDLNLALLSTIIPFIISISTFTTITCIVSRLTNSRLLSILSAAMQLFFAPFTIFTAGFTKETYAITFLYLLLLMILKIRESGYLKTTIIVSLILSISIVMSHHLTTTITGLTLVFMALTYVFIDRSIALRYLFVMVLFNSIAITYHYVFSHKGLEVVLTLRDLTTLILYTALVFYLVQVLVHRVRIERIGIPKLGFIVIAIAIVFVLLNQKYEYIPTVPRLSLYGLLLVSSYLILLLFIASTVGLIDRVDKVYMMSIIAAPTILYLHTALAYETPIPVFMYRLPNFLNLGIAVGFGLVMNRIKIRKVWLWGIATLTLFLAINTPSMPLLLTMEITELGYHWINTFEEYVSMSFLNSTLNRSYIVLSDTKAYYALKDFFNITVDTTKCAELLIEKKFIEDHYVLYYHVFMYRKGVLVGLEPIKPFISLKTLLTRYSLVALFNKTSIVYLRSL